MTRVGDAVSQGRGWILGAWVLLAVALWVWVPAANPAASESVTYLPEDAPSRQAVMELQRRFPTLAGLSEAVLVFERTDGPLTHADRESIEQVASKITRPLLADPNELALAGIQVRSPRSFAISPNPLLSPPTEGGQAALVLVEVPANFVTIRSTLIVGHLRALVEREPLPAGLSCHVTGSSGYGADYALAVERSNHRTSLVTVVAVLAILLLVYRSPLAALVPLAAVSLAAAVILKGLDVFSHFGLHAGTAERIFVFVLLYGAGTDYSLLLISRYRECLCEGLAARRAVSAALRSTAPAILASGFTNTAGLLTLCTARFQIFRTTGPAVAMALALMTLAALTLVPALLALFGRAVFWPRRFGPAEPAGPIAWRGRQRSPFWRPFSVMVTLRPAWVLIVSVLLLCAPAVVGAREHWVYDQLTALSPRYDSVQGMEIVKRHWGVGYLAPVSVVVRASQKVSPEDWMGVSRRIEAGLRQTPDVQDVRCLSRPVGAGSQPPPRAPVSTASAAATASTASTAPAASSRPTLLGLVAGFVRLPAEVLYRGAIEREYLSDDGRAMRLVVVLRSAGLSRESMDTVGALRVQAGELARQAMPGAVLFVGGATAEMDDVREITTGDFHRIAILTVVLIFLVLVALLRRLTLSLFMAACTLLSYCAVLGISQWVFVGLRGAGGLDWKVEVFLFVVMVAVGVDYSIFLGARLVQEARLHSSRAAIRRAVVHTGPVISSAGVIMAATLGSLMTGDLKLLHQLGFALALGMLLDTFIVRPLLVPSFAALVMRKGRSAPSRPPQ